MIFPPLVLENVRCRGRALFALKGRADRTDLPLESLSQTPGRPYITHGTQFPDPALRAANRWPEHGRKGSHDGPKLPHRHRRRRDLHRRSLLRPGGKTVPVRQGALPPRRTMARRAGRARSARDRVRQHCRVRARHHHRDERASRTQGREDRSGHHRRIPGRAGDRQMPASDRRVVRHQVRPSRAAGESRRSPRGSGADRGRRRDPAAGRGHRLLRDRREIQRRRRRGGRGLLPEFLRERGERTGGGSGVVEAHERRAHLRVLGNSARARRVRALFHCRAERLPDPELHQLSRYPRRRARRARRVGAGQHHGVQRRRHDPRKGA